MLCRCKEFVTRDQEEEEEDEEELGSSTVSVLAVKYLPPLCTTHASEREKKLKCKVAKLFFKPIWCLVLV